MRLSGVQDQTGIIASLHVMVLGFWCMLAWGTIHILTTAIG